MTSISHKLRENREGLVMAEIIFICALRSSYLLAAAQRLRQTTEQRTPHDSQRRPLTAAQSWCSLATPFDVKPGHDHDA
ncbi:MAG: hypothetical protein KKE51_05605 [Gammaproteobacteria bacterium]|nr:hypothetical protein [Gammaproteobacteria bacterium]MBU2435699.1 hypothetical protein [Gammaproteobacteria bacterium]MBU2449520.1 hypothetical protein [Gammaproteobacteria bacterium]